MIQLKRGSQGSDLDSYIPPAGQAVYDSTNNHLKIGNGTTAFAVLPAIGSAWNGGIINNSATILADGDSDLKYWGIQYKDEEGNNQHFRMNANNSSDYLSLTSSDSRIGTILSVKYDGTSNLFYGSVSDANTLTLKQSNIYTTTSTTTAGSYGLALKNSDIIGANALIFADECEANSEGVLFPKQNITSDVGVIRSTSNFYALRGYRGYLYFDNHQVLLTTTDTQATNGNFYATLQNGTTGLRNIGVRFYKDGDETFLYLMHNSSTNYSALYHSEYGSVISINEATGEMNYNGSAQSAWKLSTNRTIALTGAVTGSVSTDLSGNVSISTTANHNHSASNITSGTLPVARGGTSITSNPSMLVNLASTSAVGVFQTSPRPGITGILPGARGGTGNDNNTTNTVIVNNRAICYGTFSTGRYNANVAYGNHFYGNIAVDVTWPVTFASAPIVMLQVLGATEGVLGIEVGSRSTTGMTSIRVHRTDAVLDIDPFNVCYVACGPTTSA